MSIQCCDIETTLRFYLIQSKALKNGEKLFFFHVKISFRSQDINFCSDIYGYERKQLIKKPKINFKIYYLTHWETNNCNTHIVQYLKKQGQLGNEI